MDKNRIKAIENNELTYEGTPCRKAGHTTRLTSGGSCYQCGKDYRKEYREKYPEKVKAYRATRLEYHREYNKKVREENREAFNEYHRKYRQANLEKFKGYYKKYYIGVKDIDCMDNINCIKDDDNE